MGPWLSMPKKGSLLLIILVRSEFNYIEFVNRILEVSMG